jgi:hypothetical protein
MALIQGYINRTGPARDRFHRRHPSAAAIRPAMATNQRLSSDFHNPVTLPYRLAAKPATILPAWVELSALPSGRED